MAKNEVRLKYSSIILFLSRLLSVGTGLIFSLMVSRNITTQEYGIYGNLGDILSYFTLPATIISFWTTRFTATNHAGSPKRTNNKLTPINTIRHLHPILPQR